MRPDRPDWYSMDMIVLIVSIYDPVQDLPATPRRLPALPALMSSDQQLTDGKVTDGPFAPVEACVQPSSGAATSCGPRA